jgi:uncharacterized protein
MTARSNLSSHAIGQMMAHMIAILGIICACVATARAQEPPASAIAVARDVVITKGATGMADPLVRGVIETVKNQLIPTNPQLGRELNEVAAALQKEFDAKRNEVIDTFARAYARHFTEQELKDLLLFYKTPLGQKFSKEEPAAIEDGLKGAQAWGDTFSETVFGRFRTEMQKKGHRL